MLDAPPAPARRAGWLAALVLAVVAWLAYAVWNAVKPMPPGTHVATLPARLAESQVAFIARGSGPAATLGRALDIIGHAENTIVLDVSPVALEIAQQLLLRKRQRPNIKILVVTDERGEPYGGTPAHTLSALERAGVVVVRARLQRLRDPDPLYSSAWRLLVAWWDDPFDVPAGGTTLLSDLRHRNGQADRRQLLVADDGAGGWTNLITSGITGRAAEIGLEVRGLMAQGIVAGELRVAAWSGDDDRVPGVPPVDHRGVGTIDARFLSEGAVQAALRDAAALLGPGDVIRIMAGGIGDRSFVSSLAHAAARGVRLQLLLDPMVPGSQAVAGELKQLTGRIEVRWQSGGTVPAPAFALFQHALDAWVDVGSAEFTRDSLDDLHLVADIELHLPVRSGPARALSELFAAQWARGAGYAVHADESPRTYWRYRLAQATGSTLF